MTDLKRFYFENFALCGNCNGTGLQGYMDYCRCCWGTGIEPRYEFMRNDSKTDRIYLSIKYNEAVKELKAHRHA